MALPLGSAAMTPALVVAICDAPSPRPLAALTAGAIIVSMVVALVRLGRAARDYENLALSTFGGALVLGAIVATTPGLSDTGANYLARFFVGLAVGGGGGIAVALVRQRSRILLGALGLLGGGAFLGTGVLLLVIAVTATGECFG